MEVFKDISFNLDYKQFEKEISIESYKHLEYGPENLLDKALPLINPKAIFEVSYINERIDNKIKIGEKFFESRVLKEKLKDIERVFPYVCTCGDELEELQQNTDDYLEEYWLDVLKEMSLRVARNFLQKHIKDKFEIDQLSSMNPGSGNVKLWPIEQQESLFSLFGDVEQQVGVKLTDSYLMIPNKSVSGIFFPTEVKFQTCQLCTRKDCPGRKVPYLGKV